MARGEAKELPSMEQGGPEQYFEALRTRAEDVGVERDVELSPVRLYYDLADILRVGDQITIVALRNCLSFTQHLVAVAGRRGRILHRGLGVGS